MAPGFRPWLLAALSLPFAALSRAQPAPAAAATWAVQTEVAAFSPSHAPTAVVHAPPGFDPRSPLHIVVFLHGYSGCAEVLMRSGPTRCRPGDAPHDGWDLAARHDAARTNTLFVIPQLAFMRRDGDPGCFARRGCFRRFLSELLSSALAEQLGGARSLRDVASLTLVAHSGGFQAALAILERGEVAELVRGVVLLDALYGGTERFAGWLRARVRRAGAEPRLVSLYTGGSTTRRESRKLLARMRRALGAQRVATAKPSALAGAITRTPLVIGPSTAAHKLVPEQHLATLLAALPWLPKR